MAILRRVILNGFKSIKAMDLELRPLNVLIGANGAGKSNLVSFFKMLNEMMAGRLENYVAVSGQAHSILHYGPKQTPALETALEIDRDNRIATYYARLFNAAGDKLALAEWSELSDKAGDWRSLRLTTGDLETRIGVRADAGDPAAIVVRSFLTGCRVYHFHDTSAESRVRRACYIRDNHALLADGGNLAPVLLRLQNYNQSAYRRIVSTIRLIAPFFDDFVLHPGTGDKEIFLDWRETGSDQLFGPHQLSDGTLRAMCLITLLMQPEDQLPGLMIVDEPELGLHPYAMNIVASLFKKAAHFSQVIISTQSTSFLDSFEAEDVIVVNRDGKESTFERLDSAKLEAWLDEYSLGEIWEKNVIGGGPH